MTTAMFLGRFQPPHVGHLLTIRSLSERYEKVIIGVTESEPSVMPISNVIKLMRRLLTDDKFEFLHVKGSVEEGTAIIGCKFDVCCSGNPAVLARMAERGCKTEFIERSLDSLYSGTRERSEYVEHAITKSQSQPKRSLTEFRILETKSLRPIEKINPRHFSGIEDEILKCGVLNKPLIVDKLSMAVLDGSHRYAFLVKYGYGLAPVLLVDYDDESIFVGNHLGHRFEFSDNKWISKQHVRATAISGKLYEPRTTRHFFPFRKKDCLTQLNILEPNGLRSIDHLIAAVSDSEEVAMNEAYMCELQVELVVLTKYIDEQKEVLAWLDKQNTYIKSLQVK